MYFALSNKIAPQYVHAAAQFARLAVHEGYGIVCGGTSKGLMRVLIGAAIEAGGSVEGVVPEFMYHYGWADERLTHITVVETMRDRKHLMVRDADAVVALPGAIGTLEELTEVISLKRLGLFYKPIIIFNPHGFYDSLLHFFDDLVREQMMGADQRNAWRVVNNVEDILHAINTEPPWMPNIQHYHDSDEYGNQ